jgi:hypothetical protein
VLDLGCGKMHVEKYLHPSCGYIPADLVQRDYRTLYCDLNKGIIPDNIKETDIVLMLGVMEYVYNPIRVLQELSRHGKRVIISYCDTDTSNLKDTVARSRLGWVNAYSKSDLRSLFDQSGLKVISEEGFDSLQSIYTLAPKSEELAAKRVAVLSCSNIGNFGDRLGMHVLASVMPSYAVIDRFYFQPWIEPKGEYDLVVLGIGNSIFAPLLNENVLSFVRRAKISVGIFGTQYRQGYNPEKMKELIRSLDYWFARSIDDLELYSVSGTECAYLGDWLIGQFMMAKPIERDRLLKIGPEIWGELPLDRVIAKIQFYRRVYSTRLHPLLCALTSAEEVSFLEQRDKNSGLVSGKFRSIMLDVFGRTFPENKFWSVDRSSVMKYREKVLENIKSVGAVLNGVLGASTEE